MESRRAARRRKPRRVSQDPVRIATLTLSDTRTPEDDEGGALLGDLLRAAGFSIVSHAVVREDLDRIQDAVQALIAGGNVDAIVMTGGTGIAPRDRTVEAVAPLLDKTLDGFGEAFRRLSWDQIGPRGILSRAIAGVAAGVVVVALPGSPKAVRLGVEALIAPTLGHAVALASGRAVHHGHHGAEGRKEHG